MHPDPTQHPKASCSNDSALLVEDCEFSPSECLVLEVMRYFCLAFAEPASFSWDHAITRAQSELGSADGALVACSVAGVLRAIRRERRSRFEFMNAHCATCALRIRNTELSVMRLIRGARLDDIDLMKAAAMVIVEGRSMAGLLAAAHNCGRDLNSLFPDELAVWHSAPRAVRLLH
ncbi:MAG: hypothetical protein AAGL24_08050 [Pseudomonadota bacterium]